MTTTPAAVISAVAVDVAARTFYVILHAGREGAADAWGDMGGSEPSQEGAEIEAAMQAALRAAAPHMSGAAVPAPDRR